jgi:ubiquinone/menaquinone biosynthesis C-methylase UbiE
MAHKFDPKKFKKLDSAERRYIMPPKETLVKLGLRKNDVFVDIGCGIGYFTIPALEIVGPGGRVYGIDTSDKMLSELEKRVKAESIPNLHLIRTQEYEFGIQRASVTFAFMCNVLHEIGDKPLFLTLIGNMLVDRVTIAIIEWEKKESSYGPPMKHRLDRDSLNKLLADQGFGDIHKSRIHEDFYSMVGRKSPLR